MSAFIYSAGDPDRTDIRILSRRDSALRSSLASDEKGADDIFCRGCRPFSTEKEPLALSPGVSNPLAVVSAFPHYVRYLDAI